MINIKKITERAKPDFKELEAIFRGESTGTRTHFIELGIDDEILERIYDDYLGGKWTPNNPDEPEKYLKQKIEIYNKLGYDGLLEGVWRETWKNHPNLCAPEAGDTAGDLARDNRSWANEGVGIIDTWEDFEKFPWDKIYADLKPFEILGKNLPKGMKIYASTTFFEHVLEFLLGYEGLFYKTIDDPDLVTAVFDRWGEKVLEFYKQVISIEGVGAIWHADDLGFKTASLLSPEHLKRWVMPWFKKFAQVAHDHGKLFILHSCGNHYNSEVIDLLIDYVKVDVIHSYEDVILPVSDVVKKYNHRIASAGGVDIDMLCRANEKELRAYVSNIIDNCKGKKWALGTGNTVANYVPVENYLIMLEEGIRSNH
jgi:uroporphyrinogen decarboxylase